MGTRRKSEGEFEKNLKYNKIYREYKNLVMKVSYDRTHNYHTAQEITQNTFMEYFINMDGLREAMIKPWLLLVARNDAVDFIRKASTRYEILTLDTMDSYQVNYAVNPVDEMDALIEHLVQKDLVYDIMQAVKAVNKTWYEALFLVGIEGRPQEMVARELGIALPTLRARLYRARRWICKHFQDEYNKLK